MTEYEIADLALSTQAIFWQQMQVGQGHTEGVNLIWTVISKIMSFSRSQRLTMLGS